VPYWCCQPYVRALPTAEIAAIWARNDARYQPSSRSVLLGYSTLDSSIIKCIITLICNVKRTVFGRSQRCRDTAIADTSEKPASAADDNATDVADVDNEPPQGTIDDNDGRTPVLPPTSSRQPTETVVTSEAARARIQEMIATYRANVVLPDGRRKRRLQALEAAQKAAEAKGEDLAAKRIGRRPAGGDQGGPTG